MKNNLTPKDNNSWWPHFLDHVWSVSPYILILILILRFAGFLSPRINAFFDWSSVYTVFFIWIFFIFLNSKVYKFFKSVGKKLSRLSSSQKDVFYNRIILHYFVPVLKRFVTRIKIRLVFKVSHFFQGLVIFFWRPIKQRQSKWGIIMRASLVILLPGLLFINDIFFWDVVIAFYALASVLFLYSSKLTTLVVLVLMGSLPFLYIFSGEALAESVGVYTYYALVVAIFVNIKEYRFDKLDK